MPPASLGFQHLTLHSAEDVHDLFRILGYDIAAPYAFEGDELSALEYDEADAVNLRRVYLISRRQRHAVYLLEVNDLRAARLRGLAWHALQRGSALLILTRDYREMLFVDPRLVGTANKNNVRVNKLKLVVGDATRHDLDTLNAIHAHKRTGVEIYQAQGEAFNITTITRKFYDDYRRHYENARTLIRKYNPGVREFVDSEHADKLHAFTQRLLGRLMFLYFLQRKGWLGGRGKFLSEQFGVMLRRHGDDLDPNKETFYYYEEVLTPLFFETMNTRRLGNATRWQGILIPYLNGGLFDPARDPEGPILLPDSLFDPNSSEGLLAFFNRYNFTIAEDTPLEQDVAVDPEMLGKVFENLLEERDRGQSGSFYTPRPIVAYMCQETLAGYLEESAGIPRDLTRSQFDPDSEQSFSGDQAVRVNSALDSLTVLDPAVGSGSFLIGMMNEIVRLRSACWRVAGSPHPPAPLPPQVEGGVNSPPAIGSTPASVSPLPAVPGVGGEGLGVRADSPAVPGAEGSGHREAVAGVRAASEDKNRDYVSEAMIEASRGLRQEQTSAEERLWEHLRDRRLANLKFRRQHPIKGTSYIADFYLNEASLVVEVDGSIHRTQPEADQARQAEIEQLGYRVLRFSNEQVFADLRMVLGKIVEVAGSPQPPSPLPPQVEGGVKPQGGANSSLARGSESPIASPLPAVLGVGGEGLGVRATGVRAASPPPALIADWKERIIQDTLYGVDLKPEAIEIAQLRLWLALVVDQTLDQARPLPNLDYKLMAGDSLIETINGEPILSDSAAALLEGAEAGDPHAPVQRNFLGMAVQEKFALFDSEKGVQQERAKLDALRRRFFRAAPEERRDLRTQISAQERRIVYAGLHDKTEQLMDQIAAWGKKSALNNGTLSKNERAKLDKAGADLAKLEALERDLQNPQKPLPFFLYRMHFHEVFARKGGFDVVIANPPYVRQEQIKHLKESLEPAYPEVYAGTADLYVYFYARGLNLARPKGMLVYITPNKFMRAGYGKRLRDFLRQQVTLEALIDFGDLPLFDATTYPLIAVLRKAAPPPDHNLRALNVESVNAIERMSAAAQSAFDLPQSSLGSAEWQLSDPAARALMAKLRAAGTPLGQYVEGKFYYGVKTGLNEAFVIDETKRAELITADPKSAAIIKPFLRGRDVKRWRVEPKGLYLITIQNSADQTTSNAWGKAQNEAEARAIFRTTYPAIHDHLSAFEDKLRKRQDQGRYWWELRACAYYEEFEKPKIVYPDIAQRPQFALDDSGSFYLGNTLYLIADSDPMLLALLNSNAVHFFYDALSSQIRGGFYRFIAQYVEQLPIPNAPEGLRRKIAALAEKCLGAAKDHPERLPTLERQLHDLVYQAYGLNAEEIALIESQVAGKAGVESEESETEEDEG